ncbi:MAG: hypothetical protein ACTHMU_03615 [Thermomicrobiales bacterium]
MHEVAVKGEIKTLGFKEGSSGIFTGTFEGLYQGYRFGSTTPHETHTIIEVPNGTIAVTVHQEIRSVLSSRPAEHPFAGGKDPFENMPATPPGGFPGGPPPGVSGAGGPPPGMAAGGPPPGIPAGGPPPGMMGMGGPPPGVPAGSPPPGVPGGPPPGMPGAGGPPPGMPGTAGAPGGGLVHGRPFYMEVKLQVDPEKSTGIFAGSTGEALLTTPNYEMGGHLIINTKNGDVWLDFLEHGGRGVLRADLWLNGEKSTGIYQGGRGELKFELAATPPNFGLGPYSGTIYLQQAPPEE